MKRSCSVPFSAFLLLVPEFFRVLFFRYIIQVTVIVHHPASVTPESVLVPFTLVTFFPFLSVSVTETDTGRSCQVNTYRNRIVIHKQGKRISVLHTLYFHRSQAKLFCKYLEIASDDGGRYRHYLFGLRINLHESLAVSAVALYYIRNNGFTLR